MVAARHDFMINLDQIGRVGTGLTRPECVLTLADGNLYASNGAGGISQIHPDGRVSHHLGNSVTGEPLAANGFALMPDGSFLIAPLKGGPVQRLFRDGRSEVYLAEADGVTLEAPNFVLHDWKGRVWICVLASGKRLDIKYFRRDQKDGFIVLVDSKGARIAADGINFPNEVRIDPTGRYLYTNETLATRLLRFPILPDGGGLGPVEVVYEFDESNMFDGFALDSEGGAWITTLVSNRLWYVSPQGRPHLVIEDCNPEQVARLARYQATTGVPISILYEERRQTLCNIASVAFGGPDLRTIYLGNLTGESIFHFPSPVPGMKPRHWDYRFNA